jgi:hypothetical protein
MTCGVFTPEVRQGLRELRRIGNQGTHQLTGHGATALRQLQMTFDFRPTQPDRSQNGGQDQGG